MLWPFKRYFISLMFLGMQHSFKKNNDPKNTPKGSFYGISKRLRWSKNPSQASFHDSKKRRWWGKSKGEKPCKVGKFWLDIRFVVIPGGTISPRFQKRWEVSDPSWVAISLLLRWVGFTSLVINLPKWQWLVGDFSPTKPIEKYARDRQIGSFP